MKKILIAFGLILVFCLQGFAGNPLDTIPSRTTLKTWFSKGKKPTESQFHQWIDAFHHLDEDTTGIDEVPGLADSLAAIRALAESGGTPGLADSITAHRADLNNLQALTGRADGSTNMGTYTGSTISDNQTVKQNLQQMETALEGLVDTLFKLNDTTMVVQYADGELDTLDVGGGSGGSTLTEGYGINITGSVASVDTAQLTTIARTNKIDISRSLIKSDGQYVDVSGLSEYERGVQLETLAESMGQGDWLYVPGYVYKLPASGGGIELASRQSIFSFADRRARIVADSSHCFVFAGGTYRTTIESLTLETARTGETGDDNSFETPSSVTPDSLNQWDILHFSNSTPTGVVVVKDCHFSEADRDAVHIEGDWTELSFENCSFTGAGDVHRYAIYSEANGRISFDITAPELDVYLSSTSANHTIYAQGAWSHAAVVEDYGTNNNIIFEEKLKQNRPEIRGFTPLIQDFIRDPEKIVFYAPMNRLDGAVVKDYSSRKQHGVAFNGVTVETTEFGDAISLDGVNDYIEFPLQEVDVSDRKLFFSYLIKPDSTGDDGAIIGAGIISRYRYPETTDNTHALSLEGRNFDFIDNEWNHIGIALTGDSMKLFVNGVEHDQKVLSDTVINDIGGASLLVGPYSAAYMKAHIKDILLYDGYYDGIAEDAYYAATKGHQPIKTADNSPELDRGTVILYEPLDVVGKAELGFDRLTATVTGTTSSTGLYGGTQRTFDGVNDRYIFTATDSMNAENIYISALMQSPTLSNRRVVGKVGQYDLFVKNDGLYGRFYYGGGSFVEMLYSAVGTAKNGQYHHVGIGRVQDTVYLTYDGRIVDQDVVASASWDTNSNGLEIGSINNASFWLGTIDEVLIVNEFSEQLVKDIFSKITNNEPMIRLPEGIAQDEVVPALGDTYAALAGATFTGDVIVPAEAYSSSWNGSNEVPTKNDVYDAIQSSDWTNTVTQSGSDTLLNAAAGYGHFQRIGNIVSFTLRVEIALTSAGDANTVYIDPPIASNFTTAASDVIGTATMDPQSLSGANTQRQRCVVFASDSDDKIGISFDPVASLAYPENRMYISVSGSYVVQ